MPVPGQAAGLPLVPPNATAPLGICAIDPDTGDAYGPELVQYSAISTSGTTTVDVNGGLYYGFTAINTGTLWSVAAYDVFGTVTGTLFPSTALTALGAQGYPGPPGTGIYYRGNLVIVTSGTAGLVNVLWD